ncbi:MAG: glycosyltransferase family 4 protein [Anaerolineae bacterium]
MKVVMVNPGNYTPYYDYSLCKALAEIGCEVELATSPFLYDAIPDKGDFDRSYLFYRVLNLTTANRLTLFRNAWIRRLFKALEYPLDLLLFERHIEEVRPDILHYQWVLVPTLERLMFKRFKAMGIQLVYTAHNLLPHEERRWHRKQYASLYKTVNQIIVHSENNRRELVETFMLEATKVHVIPQGNFSDFSGEALTRKKAKEMLGIDPKQRVILFFGLIKRYKGVECLIKAFPTVKKRLPEAKLLIAGKPNEDFSPYENLIADLGIVADVITHPRFIPYREVVAYFCAADVVVLPYVKTYQSAVVFTAYTFGRPVIATATGGLPEVIEQGKSGYVVPPADEQMLAEAICEILLDEKKTTQMGDYARHLAETKYSWPDIARATLGVYRSLVE